MLQTVRVTYRGSLRFAASLAACIRAKGGEVTWERPDETGGADETVPDVVVDLRVSSTDDTVQAGAKAAATAGIAMFSQRFPGKGTAVVLDDGENDNNVDSATERPG
jgi:hypothetical protein